MPGHTHPFADGVFATVAQQMLDRHPVDERGRMLHSPGLRTGGKFYGFATADDLVVKLPAPRVAELIEAGDEPCLDYLLEARTFVSTGGGAAYSQ